VLLTAQALSLKDQDPGAARELAQSAAKLCPGLVPAAELAGRLLAEAGEQRKAARILESGWRESPHPDIANAYADLIPGASARDRLVRMRLLSRLAEAHPESALALANAALDAHEFAEARASLAPLLASPTRRVATLMARIEAAEHGDTGRAREWMARAVHAAHDPVWTADGVVAETWRPVSPVTGRLDAFEWRAPVSDLTPRGMTIEQTEQLLQLPANPEPAHVAVAAPLPELRSDGSSKPDGQTATGLVHPPDDPGSDPEPPVEPIPMPATDATKATRSWLSRAAVK